MERGEGGGVGNFVRDMEPLRVTKMKTVTDNEKRNGKRRNETTTMNLKNEEIGV